MKKTFQSVMSETGYEIAVKRSESKKGIVLLTLDGESFPMTPADMAWLQAAFRNTDMVRDSDTPHPNE